MLASKSRHEQFPFPSLDLSSLLLQPDLKVSKPELSLSRACDKPEQPGGPALVPRWASLWAPKLGL
jgi:hypothetical protein